MATSPAVSDGIRLERPLDLWDTLWPVRVGPFDPSLKLGRREAWRATRTPHGPAAERLRVVDGALRVDAWGPGAAWLVERAPALCGAHDDPSGFAPSAPVLRRLVLGHPGLRLGRSEAVFEAAMGAILGQRVPAREAWRSWERLIRTLSQPAPGPLPDLWLPPAPRAVAAATFHLLVRHGVDRQRATTLRRAALVAARLEETVDLPAEAARARLSAVPGIGPWTAALIMGTALGDPDAVAVGDLHLPHLVTRVLAGEPRGTDERMLQLLEPHRGHRARVIRLLLLAGAR
jgi:3-methyladenine DNA glycosylase/8-oxoguanine DNA glycosylase